MPNEAISLETARVVPYSEMSFEELNKTYEAALASNDALDISAVRKHMGDDAANKFAEMPRRLRDDWLDKNATEALENDSSAFHGIDESVIRSHINAFSDFDPTSPAALGESIALKTKEIDNPKYRDSPEYTTVKHALEYAKSQGWSEAAVLGGMRTRAAQWAGDDAPELFNRLFIQSKSASTLGSEDGMTLEEIAKEIRKERQNSVADIAERAIAAARTPETAVAHAGQLLVEYEREYPDFKDLKRKEILLNAEENRHFKIEFQAKAPDVLKRAQHEKDADPFRNGSDIKRFADLYPQIAQEQGIPLKSMPGKYAAYNKEPGQAGAEVIDRQGRRECLGNAETIDRFAAQNKLSVEDLKTLKAIDARAVPHRSTLTATALPFISPYSEGKSMANLSQAKFAVASPTKAIGMKL